MNKPAYLIAPSTPWELWDVTRFDQEDLHFQCTSNKTAVYRSPQLVDSRHPGFYAAFKKLDSLGCDKYQVTSVLKFCILKCGDMRLDNFLDESGTQAEVERAVILGITPDELLTFLLEAKSLKVDVALPSDVAFDVS